MAELDDSQMDKLLSESLLMRLYQIPVLPVIVTASPKPRVRDKTMISASKYMY